MNRYGYIIFVSSVVVLFGSFPAAVVAAVDAEGAVAATGSAVPTVLQGKAITGQASTDYLGDAEEVLLASERASVNAVENSDQPYSLDECIAVALERHLPVEIARDKLSLAQRKLIKLIRDLFPQLSFTYEHNKGFKLLKNDPVPGDEKGQVFRSEKWTTAIKQPVFKGGQLINNVRAAQADVRGAQAEYDKVFLDVLLEVGKAYFTYAKAQTMISFKQDVLAKANELMTVSEEKMHAELISEIEHLNVQSQQSQLEHDVEAIKEDIALSFTELQKVLHLPVDAKLEIASLDGMYTKMVQDSLDQFNAEKKENKTDADLEKQVSALLEIAYETRPEFVIQKSKVEASLYRYKSAVAGWFPQASFDYSFGQKAEAYIHDSNNPAWDEEHHIVFDLKWNLYGNNVQYTYDKNRQGVGVESSKPGSDLGIDGYYDRKNSVTAGLLDGIDQFAKTKEAEIAYKEALLELELSEKDIVSEVKESFYNYNRALTQLNSVNKRIAYRQKLVKLAAHRSEINEIQISEYIQAEIDLINERDSYYKAILDFLIAKVSLSKAIGNQDWAHVSLGEQADAGKRS